MTTDKGILMIRSLFCVMMLWAVVLLPLEAQQPKAGEETYVLTLRPEAAAMDDAAAAQLAATYGGELVASEGPGSAEYKVRISGSRARLLASDARVASLAPGHGMVATATWGSPLLYEYDGSGNITTAGLDSFRYDAFNRLGRSTVAGATRSYAYDAYGNRTACTEGTVACERAAGADPANNQMIGLEYDLDGNVLCDTDDCAGTHHQYTYDALNMQTSDANILDGQTYGATRFYIYTAADERIAVYTSNSSSWKWTVRGLDNKVLREFTSMNSANPAEGLGSANWKWAKDYVWRDGQLLATRQPVPGSTTGATTTYSYHLDHLGTPRLITDGNGYAVGIHDYHPFGAEAAGGANEPSLSLMKLTGHERDIVDGPLNSLDYMHARYYSAQWGRFLSVDPVLDLRNALVEPQSWNRYTYARNNPVLRVDPDGRKDKVFIVAALEAKYTMAMKQMLNSELKGTAYAGRVEVIGPSASRGQMLATLRNADSSDIVIIASHGGRSADGARGGNIGTLFNGQRQITSGATMAQWANDGSAPKAVILAGCCTNQVAQTITNTAGSDTLGTNQRTINGENQPGAVAAAGVLARGGSITEAAAAGNQHIKTDEGCGRNPGCDPNQPARFEANRPQ